MLGAFVLGILFVVAAAIVFVAVRAPKMKLLRPLSAGALAVLGVVLVVVSCLRTVPTGHTGIVTSFGHVEDGTYEAGVHFCAPWKSVVNMDNRNQKASVDLQCFSSDIQEVAVTYTINYQISKANAQTIYKEIGVAYYDTVITPRVQEAVKSEFAKYTAEQLLDNRSLLSQNIRATLTDKLSLYNIIVVDASVENLDFSDVFTDAVEAKQVAEQKSKQAQIEQQQKIMEAEAAAQRAEIDANAAAAVAKIAAEADKDVVEIQANAAEYAGQKDAAIIKQVRAALAKDESALNDDDIEHLLLYYYVQKWNGELPEHYIGTEDFYALLASLASSQNP